MAMNKCKKKIRGRLFAKLSVNLNDHALRRNPRNLPIFTISKSRP